MVGYFENSEETPRNIEFFKRGIFVRRKNEKLREKNFETFSFKFLPHFWIKSQSF